MRSSQQVLTSLLLLSCAFHAKAAPAQTADNNAVTHHAQAKHRRRRKAPPQPSIETQIQQLREEMETQINQLRQQLNESERNCGLPSSRLPRPMQPRRRRASRQRAATRRRRQCDGRLQPAGRGQRSQDKQQLACLFDSGETDQYREEGGAS